MNVRISFTLFTVLLLLSTVGFSQDTTYYDNTKVKKVLSKTDAAYFDVVEYADNEKNSKTVSLYSIDGNIASKTQYLYDKSLGKFAQNGVHQEFTENGQLESEITFLEGVQDGKTKYWHENGTIFYESDYVNGVMDGQLLVWYEDGKLKRIDTFKEGKLIAGQCYSENGVEIEHFDFFEEPQYPGGTINVRKYVSKNYKFPKSAIRSKIKGRIVVIFAVEKDGSVGEVEIQEGLSPDTDTEAIRVVKSLKNWKPGKMDGKPVRMKYRMPIWLNM